MAKIVQDAPYQIPTWDGSLTPQIWKQWYQQVSDAINRTGKITQGGQRATTVLTPGLSPWTYKSPYAGDVRLLVSGGTVSALAFSRDGITFYSIGVTSGQITLSQNDFLRVTYTVVPTVVAVPA